MTEKPQLTIAVLYHGLLDMTLNCLRSLAAACKPAYEVILLDNGSAQALDTSHLPFELSHFHLKENLGTPGGWNACFSHARADFVYCLSNDNVVHDSEMFEKLLLDFQRYKKVGAAAPMTNYVATQLQKCAGPELLPKKIFSVSKLDNVSCMWSKECWQECGGFDEAYFPGNYEDTDFCMKAREKGYQLLIDGNVWVEHKGSMTLKNFNFYSSLKNNRKLFLSRWGSYPEEKVFNLE